MSATVNIRRDVKDAFYRYKMPKIQSKIEGKGNGIKTVVSNMVEVAKALNRPPAYVTKFFGNELGSIVHCDDKTGRYIVNGAHDADKLATLLDTFIGKFVLCTSCDNPETEITVSKDGTVWRSCKACGHRSTVDMKHKLVTFIQKNPPKRQVEEKSEEGNKESTSEIDKPDKPDDVGMVAPEGIDEFSGMTESKFSDDWADSRNIRDAELAGLSASVRGSLNIDDDPLGLFADWLKPEHSNTDIEEFIGEKGVPRDKAVAIMVQALLDPAEGQNISTTFSSRLELFKRLTGTEKEQRAFLGGLERLLGLHRPELLKFLPALLQAAYNGDIIEDEAILAWHGHISKRYMDDKAVGKRVREVAAPFISWLQADSESESE